MGTRIKALFGEGEYVISNQIKAHQAITALRLNHVNNSPKNKIRYVDDIPNGALGIIDPVNGEILLSKGLLGKYKHLHDGSLIEELLHFKQLQDRRWLGRKLTGSEIQLLEKEVVGLIKSNGFRNFIPGELTK